MLLHLLLLFRNVFNRGISRAYNQGFLNNDSEVLYNIATRGLRLVILALPVVGFQVVASNFFQANRKKPAFPIFATVFRQVIMLIPLIYILPGFFDIDGIWISYPGCRYHVGRSGRIYSLPRVEKVYL